MCNSLWMILTYNMLVPCQNLGEGKVGPAVQSTLLYALNPTVSSTYLSAFSLECALDPTITNTFHIYPTNKSTFNLNPAHTVSFPVTNYDTN